MMVNGSNKLWQLLGFSSVFAVIFGIGYVAWLVATHLLAFLASANPSISAAIVGAMATVLVSVGGALYTQAQNKKREISEAHRERKVELYKEFLDVVLRIMSRQNENLSIEPIPEQELIDFLARFKTSVLLWGSPKVIKAQLSFEDASRNGGNVLIAVDQLYLAIREDIGLSNSGLNNHELVKMYLSDPSEMDSMSASNKSLQRTPLTGRR